MQDVADILDSSNHVKDMLKFLNYAYNNASAKHEPPMTDDEKMGGYLFFCVVEEKVDEMAKAVESILAQGSQP